MLLLFASALLVVKLVKASQSDPDDEVWQSLNPPWHLGDALAEIGLSHSGPGRPVSMLELDVGNSLARQRPRRLG